MTSYLIYRHGSNAANQSMTPKMAVGIVDAETYDTALRIACGEVNCCANQHLELVAEPDLSEEDCEQWNEVSSRDAELRAVGEPSVIYSE